VLAFIAAYLAWTFYPEIPTSFMGWIALIVIGIPAYLFIEWLGESTLGSSFFKNKSSFTRIILGVPVAIVLVGVALIVFVFVRQLINAVGG
jgi:hypothetical protein